MGKLAFARNSLVSFRGALDSILELAVALWQLLGYDVSTSSCTTSPDVRCKRNALADSELGIGH